ncbi:hypothetical protein Pint_14989 [Pistacia integerrima]|uniref:Uncharacterized protein n=2 Tax=Pistacia integerrima TaxID=434235 RepID=A0ACC0ZDJ8_9ROSI|nr:hypothetical protein Pint_14990 [Pistacia integerrima]KAJ0049221.1 hypothetical protein Pint_14989 [Pistacia integerrima]
MKLCLSKKFVTSFSQGSLKAASMIHMDPVVCSPVKEFHDMFLRQVTVMKRQRTLNRWVM